MLTFAENGGAIPGSWVALGGALIAALSAAMAAYFNRLSAKDKLEYDATMLALKQELKECHEDRKEHKDQIDELGRRCSELQERAEEEGRARAKLEGSSEIMGRELAEIQREVNELRSRLYSDRRDRGEPKPPQPPHSTSGEVPAAGGEGAV